MQVRIVSDGTPPGTYVYDTDGKEIHGYSRLSWNITSRGVGKAYLEFDAVKVEVTGTGPQQIPEGAKQP